MKIKEIFYYLLLPGLLAWFTVHFTGAAIPYLSVDTTARLAAMAVAFYNLMKWDLKTASAGVSKAARLKARLAGCKGAETNIMPYASAYWKAKTPDIDKVFSYSDKYPFGKEVL